MTLSRLALARYAFIITGLLLGSGGALAETVSANDSRQVYSGQAPTWLQAVGKLDVPGSTYSEGRRSHLREDCSATLISTVPGRPANTIITAWHCLANYNDLSKPITFTLLPGEPDTQVREAYRLSDGGGMHADWAILRLYRPISAASTTTLAIDPGRADPARAISMAGYSKDPGVGDYGNRLSFDPACLITEQAAKASTSNCLAHKGASGGAVVQLSVSGLPRLSGVISQGDGVGVSTYVPVAAFRNAINRHLH